MPILREVSSSFLLTRGGCQPSVARQDKSGTFPLLQKAVSVASQKQFETEE